MNLRDDISEETLDRLVDGEMPEAERRSLLVALDARPGEWRRCALAFLEAQSWKAVLRREVAPPAAVPPASVTPAVTVKNVKNYSPAMWKTWLAVAASFLLAFSLVRWFPNGSQRLDSHWPSPDIGSLAATPSDVGPSLPDDAVQSGESHGDTPLSVRLSLVGGGAAEQAIDLPIAQDAEQIQSLLNGDPNGISPHIRQLLERAGHQVEQRRQFVPVDLNDGRQLLVPIDEVRVQYTGNQQVQ